MAMDLKEPVESIEKLITGYRNKNLKNSPMDSWVDDSQGLIDDIFGRSSVKKSVDWAKENVAPYVGDTIAVGVGAYSTKHAIQATHLAATQGVGKGAMHLAGETASKVFTRYMPWMVAAGFAYEAEQTRQNFPEISKLADEREAMLRELKEKYKDELASGRRFSSILLDSENGEDYRKLKELNFKITNLSGRNTEGFWSTSLVTEGMGEFVKDKHSEWALKYGTIGNIAGYSLRAVGEVSDLATNAIGWGTKKVYGWFNGLIGRDTAIDDILSAEPQKYAIGVDTPEEIDKLLASIGEKNVAVSLQYAEPSPIRIPTEVKNTDLATVCKNMQPLIIPAIEDPKDFPCSFVLSENNVGPAREENIKNLEKLGARMGDGPKRDDYVDPRTGMRGPTGAMV